MNLLYKYHIFTLAKTVHELNRKTLCKSFFLLQTHLFLGLNVKYQLDPSSDVPRITFLQPEGSYIQEEVWPLDSTNTGACLQRVVFIRVFKLLFLSFRLNLNYLNF